MYYICICVLLMVEELKKMQHPIPKQLEVNSQVREQETHASTAIVKLRQSETLPPPLLQLRQALTVPIYNGRDDHLLVLCG